MNITNVAEAAITLLLTILTGVLIPWLRRKVNAADWEELYKLVTIAVRAAEMIYKESGLGAEKKAYVRDFLTAKGYTVDETEVDAMIEAAVLELKREAK